MTQRLAAVILENWDAVDGYAASRNMPDLATLPLGRFLSFAYWWCTRETDAKGLAKFRTALWRPPVTDARPIPRDSPWSPENETAAFAALKAGTSGQTRSSATGR